MQQSKEVGGGLHRIAGCGKIMGSMRMQRPETQIGLAVTRAFGIEAQFRMGRIVTKHLPRRMGSVRMRFDRQRVAKHQLDPGAWDPAMAQQLGAIIEKAYHRRFDANLAASAIQHHGHL